MPLKGAFTTGEGHSTPTLFFSPIQTSTFTPIPSPTVNPNILIESVVAAPNVSRNGNPVHIQFTLGHAAKVHLFIYALTGENIFQKMVAGNAGANDLLWDVEN